MKRYMVWGGDNNFIMDQQIMVLSKVFVDINGKMCKLCRTGHPNLDQNISTEIVVLVCFFCFVFFGKY